MLVLIPPSPVALIKLKVIDTPLPWPLLSLRSSVPPILQPGVAVKHCKEGTESSTFWSAIGGKQNYTSKNVSTDVAIREPHLYTFPLRNG